MAATTWRDLRDELIKMKEHQLDMNVTFQQENGEFFGNINLDFFDGDGDGILDDGHPYLYISAVVS